MAKTRPAKWPLWPALERQRGRPKPLTCFRVRAERSSRWSVYVEVYRTRDDLRKASAMDPGTSRGGSSTIVAQCCEITRTHNQWSRRGKLLRQRRAPEFAVIRLTAKSRTRDITHECFHATMRWAKRAGIASIATGPYADSRELIRRPAEERMAVVHENLCAGVVDGMYDFGYLK
jgi:hypothetical protein